MTPKDTLNIPLVRREITDAKEKDKVQHEIREEVGQEIAEQKEEKLNRANAYRALDSMQHELSNANESIDAWEPPTSSSDLYNRLKAANPLWNSVMVLAVANAMWSRFGLVKQALLDGLARGREFRDRLEHGRGLPMYPSLEVLNPMEREWLLQSIIKITGAKMPCEPGAK